MRGVALLVACAAGLAVAVLLLGLRHNDEVAPPVRAVAADQPAGLNGAAATSVAPERAQVAADEGQGPDPAPRENSALPWSPEELAKCPTDSRSHPLEQKPFLHTMMLWGGDGKNLRDGTSTFYQFDMDRFLLNLPEGVRSTATNMRRELIEAARELEKEHWKSRYEAYHAAVEAGSYVIVDCDGLPESEAAVKIAKAREALGLGELNRDYFYMVASARPPDGRPYGTGRYSAIIYVRRSEFPRSFELLDEIARTMRAAEDAIRARLGVPR